MTTAPTIPAASHAHRGMRRTNPAGWASTMASNAPSRISSARVSVP